MPAEHPIVGIARCAQCNTTVRVEERRDPWDEPYNTFELHCRPGSEQVCSGSHSGIAEDLVRPDTEADRSALALEWAQARPCGNCLRKPRTRGDHLCDGCRNAVRTPEEREAAAVEEEDQLGEVR